MTPFSLNYLFKDLTFEESHSEVLVRLQPVNLGDTV